MKTISALTPTALQELTPASATTSTPLSVSKTTAPEPRGLFELPAPENFTPTPDHRELDLSPAETDLVLALARRQKYQACYDQWYNWRISQERQPRAFTAEEIMGWFTAEARRVLGRDFVVDKYNNRILRLLCYYFAEDERFETELREGEQRRDLRKGLFLRGGVGCGKTTLLTIFQRNPRLPYVLRPCRQLVTKYTERGEPGAPLGGIDALTPYTRMLPRKKGDDAAYNYREGLGLALDDIGTEDWRAKHYGTELNVVEHLLGSRDDAVVAGHLPRWATHATSNLPFDDVKNDAGNVLVQGLQTIYGLRIRSRIRGLCNILTFPDSAPDRRG